MRHRATPPTPLPGPAAGLHWPPATPCTPLAPDRRGALALLSAPLAAQLAAQLATLAVPLQAAQAASPGAALGAALALPQPGAAAPPRTWHTGRGTGQTLAQALRQAGAGDLVLVHGDLHGETGVVEQPGLTLRGVAAAHGPRPVLHAEGRSAEGKAIVVVRAPGVRIEQLGFAGARVRDGNGAGIRLEDGSLAVFGCSFTDNEMGLLTANRPDLALVLRGCRFADAPRHAGRLHHLLYVGRIGRFELHGCTLANGFRGHLVKSRARLALLLGNLLDDTAGTDPRGAASYELELAEGGRALLAGNVLVQSPGSSNAAVLSIGAEAAPGAVPTEVWLLHNTLAHRGGGTPPARFVHWWTERLGAGAALHAFNNLFLGPGAPGLAAAAAEGGNLVAPVVPPGLATPGGHAPRPSALAGWRAAPLPPAPAWLPGPTPGAWPWTDAAQATAGAWTPPQAPGASASR